MHHPGIDMKVIGMSYGKYLPGTQQEQGNQTD
jgi:hypothetical protein